MSAKKLYFLASYPKAGNTWCRSFLLNYTRKTEDPVGINDMEEMPIASRRSFVDEQIGIESSLLTDAEISSLRRDGLQLYNARVSDKVVLKVHDAFPCGKDPDWFPKNAVAGVVYIVRNPFDVAVSLANHRSVSLDEAIQNLNDDSFAFAADPYKLHLQFHQTLHSWSRHVQSWLDGYKGDICLVRYEDMLADPFGSFGKIVRAIGYEYDENRLETAIRNSDFKVLKRDEEAHGFKEKTAKTKVFFREGKSGTWRKHLSEQNVRDIVNGHREVMTRLGYMDAGGGITV
jgi:aryl sulfotransferase